MSPTPAPRSTATAATRLHRKPPPLWSPSSPSPSPATTSFRPVSTNAPSPLPYPHKQTSTRREIHPFHPWDWPSIRAALCVVCSLQFLRGNSPWPRDESRGCVHEVRGLVPEDRGGRGLHWRCHGALHDPHGLLYASPSLLCSASNPPHPCNILFLFSNNQSHLKQVLLAIHLRAYIQSPLFFSQHEGTFRQIAKFSTAAFLLLDPIATCIFLSSKFRSAHFGKSRGWGDGYFNLMLQCMFPFNNNNPNF